jgi:L-iditol 2-dehydrogenase
MDGSTGRRIPPIIMGHEAAGEILSSNSQHWHAGDRVTFDSTIFCGSCVHCRRGEVNLCESRQVVGVSCTEYQRAGAFAELIAVPSRTLHRLPENLSFEHAALAEPLSVALHAIRLAQVEDEERVVVIGAGMIGLLIIQALRAKFECQVKAIDVDPRKLELARAMGAEEFDGEADVAIEAVGISATIGKAVTSVRKRGRVILVGNVSPSPEFPLQLVVTREISMAGSCASAGEYPEALELLAAGKIKAETMITNRCPLEEAPEYFRRLRTNDPTLLKVIVCP